MIVPFRHVIEENNYTEHGHCICWAVIGLLSYVNDVFVCFLECLTELYSFDYFVSSIL